MEQRRTHKRLESGMGKYEIAALWPKFHLYLFVPQRPKHIGKGACCRWPLLDTPNTGLDSFLVLFHRGK